MIAFAAHQEIGHGLFDTEWEFVSAEHKGEFKSDQAWKHLRFRGDLRYFHGDPEGGSQGGPFYSGYYRTLKSGDLNLIELTTRDQKNKQTKINGIYKIMKGEVTFSFAGPGEEAPKSFDPSFYKIERWKKIERQTPRPRTTLD
ncbi:MAG: hypothetical protein U0800_19400 [Isosphaeraceae bacterium]